MCCVQCVYHMCVVLQDVCGAVHPGLEPGSGGDAGGLRLLPAVWKHSAGPQRDQIYPY